jgi:hypothetical protein
MERPAFPRVQRGQEFVCDATGGGIAVAEEGPAGVGEDDDAAAAVRRIRPPLGQAQPFQVVDEAGRALNALVMGNPSGS